MTPIRDAADLRTGSVLYHSAFGFARVASIDPEWATLEWEGGGENLPNRVSMPVLVRVYALCPPNGFFHRSVHDRAALEALLAEKPIDALALLLAELPGKQTPQDCREWLSKRGLTSATAFEHWWSAIRPVLSEDPRFMVDADGITLRPAPVDDSPRARLQAPHLPPGRRLDLALEVRAEIGDDEFFEQVLLAWRTGGTHVKDLALASIRHEEPERILTGLAAMGASAIEALIHAIRHGGWSGADIADEVHGRIADLVVAGIDEGSTLDAESRLAAALVRWPSDLTVVALADEVLRPEGRQLVRGTFAALAPRRAEQLAVDLLDLAIQNDDRETAQWLAGELLGLALVDHEEVATRLEPQRPLVAQWLRTGYQSVEARLKVQSYDANLDEEPPNTAEVALPDAGIDPIPLARLPARSGASLIGLGLGLARAIATHHKEGRTVNPTGVSVRVMPDETIEVDAAPDTGLCPRPLFEPPSFTADVYAASVLLLEALLGRPWPRNLPASRAIPYLRLCVPQLPPSALAPLDAGLHPDPTRRPVDGLAWLARWQSAAVAEESRTYAARNALARLQTGYDSHIGRMKVPHTQVNQDCLALVSKGPLSLLVVCDGISTANAGSGDVASSIACHVIANLWEQALPRLISAGAADLRAFLDRALRTANTAVCEAALRFAGGDLEGRIPMGTTCAVAVVHGNWVCLAWLGDSRAYLIGPAGTSLLSGDENQAAERLRAWHLGQIDAWDPSGFALVGYLGHFDEQLKPFALPANHASFTLLPGEYLALCSDGITDYVGETHAEVGAALAEVVIGQDPDEACRQLVAAANRGGGGDNATILVARLWP